MPGRSARPLHTGELCLFSSNGPRVGRVIEVGGALVAHQGGWDEILLVVAPMVVVGGLLWVAKRRVDRAAAAADNRRSDPFDPGSDRS